MSHPRYYLAVENPDAPHGWSTPEGMHYRPDFGDRLVELNGVTHIEVSQLLSFAEPGDAPNVPPLSSALV